MAHHNYRAEPNPRFSPDKKYVFFTSNMFGRSYVFAAEVAKADGHARCSLHAGAGNEVQPDHAHTDHDRRSSAVAAAEPRAFRSAELSASTGAVDASSGIPFCSSHARAASPSLLLLAHCCARRRASCRSTAHDSAVHHRLEVSAGGCARRGEAGLRRLRLEAVTLPHDWSIAGPVKRGCSLARCGRLLAPPASAGIARPSPCPLPMPRPTPPAAPSSSSTA